MADHRSFAFVVVCFLSAASTVRGLRLAEFYSYGKKSGDAQLKHGSHKLVKLSTPVMFNGEAHDSLYVNSNGVLSFISSMPFLKPSQNFPNGYKLLAPFYADLSTTRMGMVFYRETQEELLLLLASAEVYAAFFNERQFEATSLFIATWLHVGLQNSLMNKTVSFQAVLVSDGKKTFTLFHYNDEERNQRTNIVRSRLPSTTFPKAGFSNGNELSYFYLPNSGTSDIFQLSQTSNVKIPGKWVYLISSRKVSVADAGFSSRKGKFVAWDRDVSFVDDRRVITRRSQEDTCGKNEVECSVDAVCKKTSTECCVCNTDFYGNGQICFKHVETVNMQGKISGSINGESLDGVRLTVVGDVPSRTTFVGLEPVSPSIGFQLRVLTSLVSTFSFLFARPSESSGNGFDFLGVNFVRRSRVTFETGEVATIRETMLDKDYNGFYNFEVIVNGNVPVFDEKKDIKFTAFVHKFRYDRLGIMSGFYRSTFKVGEKEHSFSVVEVLQFDEEEGCLNIGISRMKISEQRSAYFPSKKVLNLARKTEMLDEEACGEENRKCHRQAKCVVKTGVKFCECNAGFHGDGYSCQDVEECLLKIHDCSSNANCTNTFGSYKCKCRQGFLGDGKSCRKVEGRCGERAKKCHSLARCITKDGKEICECNFGYIGDGVFCQDADECELDIDMCAVNADCMNTPGSYKCQCKDGYTGDGETCLGITVGSGDVCTADGHQCDPTEDCVEGKCQCKNGFLHDSSVCTDIDECQLGIHTCDKTATCLNTVGSFKCTCNEGYTGDGYKCVLEEVIIPLADCHGKKCHDDGYCDRSGKVPVCRCNQGYGGDGVSCQDVDECDNDQSSCHNYATCKNNIGSYTCECRPGYQGDGRKCVYVDPCKDVSCNFYARCIMHDGSPMCQCYPGYYGDGQSCKDFNECQARRDYCDSNAKCVNTPGSYRCFCLPGYNGDGFSCKSDGSCGGSKCHREASCVQVDGVKQCQCKQGFLGSGLICVDNDECSNATLVQCPQFSRCYNTLGSFKCRCDPGYKWNGAECKSVCLRCLNGGQCADTGCVCREGYSGKRCQWVGDEFLVFTRGSTMQRLSLPPRQDTIGILLQSTRGLLVALDFDHMNKMIYFTDVARKAIWRVAFNGTGAKKIVSEGLASPEGIAVDYVGGNLYWTDSMFDRVEVSKLNGSDRKVLFSTRLFNPRSIVVHPEKGTMYWADWNRAAPKIEVAHMDGGSRRVFVQHNMGLPNGLTLDRRNDELCWTDAMYGAISCANLDDGKARVVYSAARYPFGITSFGQYLIWTDWDARTIQQYDRQSFKLQPPIKSFRGSSGSFYEIKTVQKPEDIDSHECSDNNGGCSNLCLSRPGGRTCACANGYYLVSKEARARLTSLGSGSGSGSGFIGSSFNETTQGPIIGSGSGSGFGSGSGVNPKSQTTPATPFNSTLVSLNATVCIDEENYKLLHNLS